MIKSNNLSKYLKFFVVILFLVLISFFAIYIKNQSKDTGDVVIKEDVKPKDVIVTAKAVLIALKSKDYVALENLTSSDGLSWNEYPSLDFSKSDISKPEISDIPTNSNIYMFGYTDGEGKPIKLTIEEYLYRWIYNKDYINANEVAINKILDGGSNVLNTIIKDSGNRTVVAFHFKGFDSKYEGMDWTTIYLVFDLENGEYKLRGVAKSNWTI